MTQAVYQWVRNLAVYYIVLTALMHIMPSSQYGRYIRYFMGILLILIISSPLLNLLHLKEQMDGLFQKKMLEEEFLNPQGGDPQDAARDYYLQAYERETAEQIGKSLEKVLGEGCEILDIKVQIQADEQSQEFAIAGIQIGLSGAQHDQIRERVEHELAGVYGITGEKVGIFFEEVG